MKIAIVHSYYSSVTPSGENIVVDMQAAALTEAGHDVKVVALRTDELRNRPFYKARASLNVASGLGASPLKELKKFRPDIVHVHNLFPNFSTRWLKKWRGPVVATMHNFRPICSNGLMFRDGHQCSLCPEQGHHNAVVHACYRDSRLATLPIAIRNRNGVAGDPLFSRAQELIVLSERSRSTYKKFGANASNLTVVPNFINPPTFSNVVGQDRSTWIYAGRLNVEKGIVDLLQRWPRNERLIVAGTGNLENKVQEMAKQMKNVTFVGPIPREQLLSLICNAKGVVIPSLCAENLPTIYLEALTAGTPVIARRGNSAADDIDTWAPGLTYNNTQQLHEAIEQATQNHQDLSIGARQRFRDQYTKATWLRNIEAIYQDAFNRLPHK
ncbi:glycosyltransferase family 4 protein [Kocuria sediminis]|nr:glycosyltransferase family 4 protein [Kocuria sediminis]